MAIQKNKICLVGAGLANGMLAWFLSKRHPDLPVVIYESKSCIDLGRTWSFHKSDISPTAFKLMESLAAYRWPAYEVRFPQFHKRFESEYLSVTPEVLHNELLNAGVEFQFSSPIQNVFEDHIVFDDGQKQFFSCVFDGRGFKTSAARLGYQKFVGQVLRLKKQHGLTAPLLMDATVKQVDGYRFFYTLPLSNNEVLVEDTRYANNPDLDHDEFANEIARYAKAQGWDIEQILKVESGVLPIPLDEERIDANSSIKLGMAGGFFHPVTGYSLADCVRMAEGITELKDINKHTVAELLKNYRSQQALRRKFYFLLNRMMFLAAPDAERRKIFEHFYGLSPALIERFYSGSTNAFDALRILTGKPPVDVWPAVRAVFSRKEKEAI
ncbi:MAG: hypothetical protein OM95_15840 [Bdellovibrio sp. ArHS]|uniref:lycopene beta-cyclase CrtY n=1 Tax=Bdellovibrio sp. ArHS TaxID=1569284 RepID=UPI000583D222|nr:lycopene beta-cyclase CrtY [Bdellovibrio sp. ArHS]KHD87166.1 MAG: hypothetical protein OM95_15840 [Bdellovibrio sp. ArHS]